MAYYFEILCVVAALLLAICHYVMSTYDFWKKRGVVGPDPIPFFGNTKDIMLGRISTANYINDIYSEYKSKSMIGLFMGSSPVLVVNDPELIKDVLIRDFSKFASRGTKPHERTQPLSPHLFNLEPERWRPLRSRLSPIFTSGKLREMFDLIVECSHHLEEYLDVQVEKEEPIEVRELMARYATDVIGSCAFGIDMSALADEDSEFREKGRQYFAVSLTNVINLKLKHFLPRVYDLLGFVMPDTTFAPFFTKVVMDTIEYRRENEIVRPDFINMLMELQDDPYKLEDIELTDTMLAAQAFVFFVAGFETSSAAMSNALYELAKNPDIQEQLREEILEHLDENDGELSYDGIKEMQYLDKVFKETLRMYPVGAFLMREAVADYILNGTKVAIPKKTLIWIPVYAMHRDPDIYPDPDSFDPERFDEDAIEARHPMHYLPFGDGPRNCIGARFAVYQTKVGLITILRDHRVEVCDETMIPYEFDPGAFLLAPKGGIYLKITKISSE